METSQRQSPDKFARLRGDSQHFLASRIDQHGITAGLAADWNRMEWILDGYMPPPKHFATFGSQAVGGTLSKRIHDAVTDTGGRLAAASGQSDLELRSFGVVIGRGLWQLSQLRHRVTFLLRDAADRFDQTRIAFQAGIVR